MKFLFDAHHVGRRQTGNETWTRNIAASIQEHAPDDQFEFEVTREGEDELRRLTGQEPHIVSGHSAARLIVDLPRRVRAIRPDALLVTYTMPITRCPSVVVVHDISFQHRASAAFVPWRTRLRARATVPVSCRFAAGVITVSEFTKRDVVETLHIPEERVAVAPNAVDPRIAALITATPRRVGPSFTVLAVGNVLPRKNLVTLAEAVLACRQQGSDVRLRVVGTVPAEGRPIAETIGRTLGPAVSFSGYVPLERLVEEYRAADVLGVPSRFEGFGVPVIEAMAAGLPVVVSDATSLREVAGDAALLCPPSDVRAWRDALLRLAADPSCRQELRRRGEVRAGEFSWSESAKVVAETLRRAAARPTSATRVHRGR